MKKFCATLLMLSIVFGGLALPAYGASCDTADYQYRLKNGEIVKEPIPNPKKLLEDEHARQMQEKNGDKSVLSGDGKTVTQESLRGEVFNIDKVRGQLETAIAALPEGQDTVVLRLVDLTGDFRTGDFIILRETASNAGLKLEVYVDYKVDGKVFTRSYLNKDNMDKGYKLGVDDLNLSGVRSMVEKSGSGDTVVFYVGENGGNVRAAQLLPKTMNTADLRLYSYNPSSNTYTLLSLKDAQVDDSSHLYFTANSGGYYIISDGTLKNIVS